MPTFDKTPQFLRDYDSLTPEQKALFLIAVRKFIADLRAGRFRQGLRVKAYRRVAGWFEMTWAPDGRALFSYGTPIIPGEPHVIWQRVGGHEVFDDA